MTHRLLRMVLWSGLLLVCGFGFAIKVTFATVLPEDRTPDANRTFLLARKADEWEIIRELSKLTTPLAPLFVPTYSDLPFTRQRNGAVVLGDETYSRYVAVSSAAELTTALAKAEAGDFIHLLDGIYLGNFEITRSGLADKRIALYGSRHAVLDGQGTRRGYGLHLMADQWLLLGFTIRNAAKGL
jgi:hypothetical protein